MSEALGDTHAICLCGHRGARHVDLLGPCEAAGCGCGGWRANLSVVEETQARIVKAAERRRSLPAGNTVPASIVEACQPPKPGLFTRAAASPDARTRAMGVECETLLAALAARLDREENYG